MQSFYVNSKDELIPESWTVNGLNLPAMLFNIYLLLQRFYTAVKNWYELICKIVYRCRQLVPSGLYYARSIRPPSLRLLLSLLNQQKLIFQYSLLADTLGYSKWTGSVLLFQPLLGSGYAIIKFSINCANSMNVWVWSRRSCGSQRYFRANTWKEKKGSKNWKRRITPIPVSHPYRNRNGATASDYLSSMVYVWVPHSGAFTRVVSYANTCVEGYEAGSNMRFRQSEQGVIVLDCYAPTYYICTSRRQPFF